MITPTEVIFRDRLLHERTLLGAVDSYLKELVHKRAYLVKRHEEILAELTERWFANGGANQVEWLQPD